MESGALGITPCVSTKRMRASEPINLIINPSSACGEGGEGTPESLPSRGVHPLHSGCWWAQGVGGKAGVQPPVPPQLFLHAESPGRVYLAQTAASWSEQPPPARTHGTGAKNRPVTLHRQRGTGGGCSASLPQHPPPPSRAGPAPHHDSCVLRGAGDDVVVVGTPVDVQHGRRVSRHQRVVLVHPSCLQW